MIEIVKTPIKVVVNKLSEDKLDLICTSELGAEMRIDPFVGCAASYSDYIDPEAIIGKVFIMNNYWLHPDGTFLCHNFSEVNQ